MEQDSYRDRLAAHCLRVLVPPAADRAQVHRIIYDERCVGVAREESRQIYRDITARLANSGAEGVVLGCIEMELLISSADSPVPVFPAARLHVQAAVEAPLESTTSRG